MTAKLVPLRHPICRHKGCWVDATHEVSEYSVSDARWHEVTGPFCEVHARMKMQSLQRAAAT